MSDSVVVSDFQCFHLPVSIVERHSGLLGLQPGSSVRGLSRQEHCGGLPCPTPGDLSDPAVEPESLALQADSWEVQINVPSPNAHGEILTPRGDGMRRWWLWEVLQSGGWSPDYCRITEAPETSWLLLPFENTMRTPAVNREEGPSPEGVCASTSSWTSVQLPGL